MNPKNKTLVLICSVLLILFLSQCSNQESKFIGKWEYVKQDEGDDFPFTTFREFEFFKAGNVHYRFLYINPMGGGFQDRDGVGEYKLLDDKKVMVKVDDKLQWVFIFDFPDSKTMTLVDKFRVKYYYKKVN